MNAMKLILALLLALVGVCADAAFDVPMPVAKATFPPPDVQMPPGKIYIDTTTIPASRFGSGDIRLKISCGPLTTTAYGPKGALIGCGGDGTVNAPDHKGDGPTGAFRISCSISHYSFDDPIVWPGQSGRTHLHQFFGNTVTDAQHDASKMETFGNSTCNGGIANRTGYWVPAFIYHCPVGEVGCNRSRDGQVQPTTFNDAYYKSTAASVASFKTTKWWPKGFRMIAGDPNNWEPSRMPLGSRFDCYDAHNGTYAFYDHLPNTADAQALPQPCVEVNMMIKFPECSIDDETVLYQPTPIPREHQRPHAAADLGLFRGGLHPATPDDHLQHPRSDYRCRPRLHTAIERYAGNVRGDAGRLDNDIVVLDAAESANANYYVFGSISIAGQPRRSPHTTAAPRSPPSAVR
jgi:hypothetical protein